MINERNEDNTDLGIAEVIAKAGIPKSKIVLEFWAALLEENDAIENPK